jgi:hypothetical protein
MKRPSSQPPRGSPISTFRKAQNCARRALTPLFRLLLASGLPKHELIILSERTIRQLPDHSMAAQLKSIPECAPLQRLVARWVNDSGYLERGHPMRLRLKGPRPSFQALVKSGAPSLSWAYALDALQRAGVAKVARDRKVQLLSHFYSTRLGRSVDIELVTTMVVDFLRAHELNILKHPRSGHGIFQRIAHNLNSDSKLAPVFNRYVREQGQLFLEGIDEWLIRHQPRARGERRRKRVRLGVGIYVINEALR